MCTVVVSIDSGSRVPVLLAGVRDEFHSRPWARPARHWPEWPDLVGGVDLQAGGTWLAVDPHRPRVACILNGFGQHAPEATRRSRGRLPLLAAIHGELPERDLTGYDPFHLVIADLAAVTLWSWNGADLVHRQLRDGLHMIVNSGLEGQSPAPTAPPGAVEDMQARLAYFRPLLAGAARPKPIDGDPATAWGDWLAIIGGAGLDPADPHALVVRRDFGDRGPWGTSSLSLVGLRPGGVRYDFSPWPQTIGWTRIDTSE